MREGLIKQLGERGVNSRFSTDLNSWPNESILSEVSLFGIMQELFLGEGKCSKVHHFRGILRETFPQ